MAVNWVGNKVTQARAWVGRQWHSFQQTPVYQVAQRAYMGASNYVSQRYRQASQTVTNVWEQAKATGQSVYNWGVSKTREAAHIARNWTKALEETVRHVCTTAEHIGKASVNFLKNVDWKKVGIVAAATVAAVTVTVATAGAAAGGTYALTSGVLSGKDAKTILKDVGNGMVSGAASGTLTGGLLGGFGNVTSTVTNPFVRYAADTLGETTVDTLSDAAQGGKVTPASIATSLAINAVSEGVPTRAVKEAKADVLTNKPKAGEVPSGRPT